MVGILLLLLLGALFAEAIGQAFATRDPAGLRLLWLLEFPWGLGSRHIVHDN